jgi:predicted amidohydrolase YtcJ
MTDLILVNANVITMNPALPNAQRITIKNGKIHHVESHGIIKGLRDLGTTVIDCQGKTVLPGFIDAHLHFFAFAESLVTLSLEPRHQIHSISDIQARIRRFSENLRPGTWIRGRGYNEFYLAEKRHPTRWDLDGATAFHPIKLTHRSGNAYVLNSQALKLVGISKETPDPPEGLIDRDIETGEPTGILYGMGDILAKAIPPLDLDQMKEGIKLATEELCASGITSIHDASPRNDLKRWESIKQYKEDNLLKPRITLILGKDGFEEYRRDRFPPPVDDDQVSLGGVKIILHETTGQLTPAQTYLNEMVLEIHRAGMQAILHAIEEKTIHAACTALEYALNKSPRADHRHRIEHCSVCSQELAKRVASLGVTVVSQPSFIYYNGERYLRTVPESNLRHLYPLATLLKSGVRVAGSSDCPIAPANPLIGIYSAVSRRAENGEYLLPEEGISPVEALRMYTISAAEATFTERTLGSVSSGKLADLVMLSADPTRLPADKLKDIKVEMTILNGEVVWHQSH